SLNALVRVYFFYDGHVVQVHHKYLGIYRGLFFVIVTPHTDICRVVEHFHIAWLVQVFVHERAQAFKGMFVHDFYRAASVEYKVTFVGREGDRLEHVTSESSIYAFENRLLNLTGRIYKCFGTIRSPKASFIDD